MSKVVTFHQRINGESLTDELIAAGIAVITVSVRKEEPIAWVYVPDDADDQLIQNVVTAHNPDADSRATQEDNNTRAAMKQLVQDYQNTKDQLDQTQTKMRAFRDSTGTPTLAQLTNASREMAGELLTMAIIMDRLLDRLRAMVIRLGLNTDKIDIGP